MPPGCAEDVKRIAKMVRTLAEREGLHVNTYCARNLNYVNFIDKLLAGRVTPRKMVAVERQLKPLL